MNWICYIQLKGDLGSLVGNEREEVDIDSIGDSVMVRYTKFGEPSSVYGITFIIIFDLKKVI